MNLQTSPAANHAYNGELNLLSQKYFPNEDRRLFKIEVTHGPLYKSNCNSCQAGVTYIKQAFDYLDKGSIVWNQNITEQSQDRVVIQIGSYTRSFSLKESKVCVVPVEPTVPNLLAWFCEQFKGQLELAHVNIISMSSENDGASLTLGY